MITHDIPYYLYRPNSIKETISSCELISTDINLWYKSLVWMTGYFTFGSWISLNITSTRLKLL